MSKTKLYIIYDERAIYDEDEATVLDTAESKPEALEAAKAFAPCVIFRYTKNGSKLTNPEMVVRVEDGNPIRPKRARNMA